MHKLVVLVWSPPSNEEFEINWSERFVPLAEQMPGLRRVAVSRPYGTADNRERPYLMHEFFFEDRQALREALASPAGQKAGAALMEFAGQYAQVVLAEHLEEARPLVQAGDSQ